MTPEYTKSFAERRRPTVRCQRSCRVSSSPVPIRDQTQSFLGLSLSDVADRIDGDAFDALFALWAADELKTGFSGRPMANSEVSWEIRRENWADPRVLIGASDAGAHVQVLSTFDYTTSFLALVREHGGMDVATAVRKLTDVPARLYGLTDRGRIAEGAFADFVVFDPDTVGPGEHSSHDDLPGGAGRIYKEPTGIAHVVVNGTEIVGPEGITGERPGAVLRRAQRGCLNNAGRVEVSAPGPRVVGRHVHRIVRPHCRAGTPGSIRPSGLGVACSST